MQTSAERCCVLFCGYSLTEHIDRAREGECVQCLGTFVIECAIMLDFSCSDLLCLLFLASRSNTMPAAADYRDSDNSPISIN